MTDMRLKLGRIFPALIGAGRERFTNYGASQVAAWLLLDHGDGEDVEYLAAKGVLLNRPGVIYVKPNYYKL